MPSSEVFKKYGSGNLHSGSKKGPVVKNHAQAVAIFLSEKRKEGQHGGHYPEKQFGGAQGFTGMPPAQPQMPMGLGFHGQGGHFGNYSGPRTNGVAMPQSMSQFQFGSQFTPQMLSQLQQAQPMLQPGSAPAGMPQTPMGMAGMPMRADGGGLGYQFGGSPTSMGLTPGWIERQEARNISHTGPIISAVGGRTDHHALNVPSGAYVLPAGHVAALGQGNTLNGMKILQGMFGPSAPLRHGPGPPRAAAPHSLMPKTPGLGLGMSSSGGSRGDDNTGRPVPIMAAGGEYVIGPEQVARVGKGNLDHGHAILDSWVKKTHKKFAKTIANLPPPAKS